LINFPWYSKTFRDIFGKSSTHLLIKFPTPSCIIEIGKDALEVELKKASGGRINSGCWLR
jgi:hypothetical protein